MNESATYRVSVPQACTGRSGRYEMWMHRLPRGDRPQLERVPLTGDCYEVEKRYNLAGLLNPVQLLDTLRKASAKLGAARFHPDELVTASLVRFCTQVHRSGAIRSLPGGRPEAVWRRVWMPDAKALGERAIRLAVPVALDENGIGEFAVPGVADGSLRRPIVSVPLTSQENTIVAKLAVPLTAGTDPAHSTYALLHFAGERQFIEQVLVPASPPGAAG